MAEINILDRVVKDAGEIQGRLFDHRPFVKGEINFLVKEFEEKRNDREIQQLFEILESVTEIRETQIDKAVNYGDTHLCNLTANLEVALRMCNNVVEKQDLQTRKPLLEQRRECRKREWCTFIEDIKCKNDIVNQAFSEKEQQLRNYYSKVEESLNISPSSVKNKYK